MPEKDVIERAHQDARAGKSPSTQAGEFVHEEIEHIREGKHGAKSTKQAIAIGLSKARRAGVKLPPPGAGSSSQTRRKAAQDTAAGEGRRRGPVSRKRSRATTKVLEAAGPLGRLEEVALEAGNFSGSHARSRRPVRGGAKGGPDEGRT